MVYGGKEFTERRVNEARERFRTVNDVFRFGAGLVVIVLSALMIADGVVAATTGTGFVFQDVSRPFEFVVGLIGLLVGASLVPQRNIVLGTRR